MQVRAIEPNDIDQGQLGDCWYLSALAAIAETPEVVQEAFFGVSRNTGGFRLGGGRTAKELRAAGAWRVALCKDGWWTEVLVDDYLPCSDWQLAPIFGKNREEPGEMWVAVMEKAYAKLHGSYAAIVGGDPLQALQDLTGFPYERFQFGTNNKAGHGEDATFARLLDYDRRGFLMTAGINGGRSKKGRAAERVGLVTHHAYTLLKVVEAPGGFRLLQFRNPWGNAKEWTGDWADGSPLWERHPDVAAAAGFTKAEDGTFWMSWQDADKWWDYGGVCLAQASWFEARFRCAFGADNVPTAFLELTVKRACSMYLGVHQRSTRGLPDNHPDSEHHAYAIKVLAPPVADKKKKAASSSSQDSSEGYSVLASSSYMAAQHVHLEHRFKPASRPYYVFVCKHAFARSAPQPRTVTVSLHHEHSGFGRLRLLRGSKPLVDALQYLSPCPYGPFEPEKAEPVAVEMQRGSSREELVKPVMASAYP